MPKQKLRNQLHIKGHVHFGSWVDSLTKNRIVTIALVVVLVATVGYHFLLHSHAATFAASSEAESGSVAGNAASASDSNASGGMAVKFGSSTSSNPDPVGQPAGKWTMKFDDEFTGSLSTVDAANGLVKVGNGPTWKAWYPNDTVGDGNQHSNNPGVELEYYDIPGLSASNGILTMTATHDNAHSNIGLPYTSGMIQSNPSFNPTYGYAEARMKLPAVGGSWPAFWTEASNYAWPPEVDIMENFGSNSQYSTTNFGNPNSGTYTYSKVQFTDTTQWHVYGLQWEPGNLIFYLDGVQVGQEPIAGNVPSQAMYLTFDLAVNSTATQQFSAQVDYARYWQ